MRVLLDEEVCELAEPECVGEALHAAAVLARRRGRVIVDVFVDGLRWSAEQLASSSADVPALELRLYSAEPGELVRQTLVEASTALVRADALQRDAATLLQSDQPQPAMSRLGEAIAIWQSVQKAVTDGAELLGLDLDQVRVNDEPLRGLIARLSDHLTALRTALAVDDPIGLSDTLLYEMPDVVDQWRTMLEELQSLAGGAASPREDSR